ncbi:class C sortase [Leucobacter zeae]|nr:class C sortase [Leucobacter zeae]
MLQTVDRSEAGLAEVPAPSRATRRWRPSLLTIIIVVLALAGLTAGLYPMTASWVSSYNQSKVLVKAGTDLANLRPAPDDQLRTAHAYNDAFTAGVELEAGGNIPIGVGTGDGAGLKYEDLLKADDTGLMGRIKIPGIDVDLPIYHGTSEASLLRGAGHLEGSHLPVGGAGTRSVITAHRGLANATMFSNLDKVEEGDTFSINVLGKVLTYQVFDIQVIDPDDSGSLRAVEGKDLVTLITCTPLGINTHRIVVTGERITPTPEKDLRAAREAPAIPGFPWWAVYLGTGLVLTTAYLIRRGFLDEASRSQAPTA